MPVRAPGSWRRWRAAAPAPVAGRIGRLTVSLPMFHALTFDEVERVVAAVEAILIQPQLLQ